jgi:hypothetical protein
MMQLFGLRPLASTRGPQSVGRNDCQFNTIEADAARVRGALRDLDAVAVPAQQSCEVGALRHVPTDNHDPAAHPIHPRTARTRRLYLNAAACYQPVTSR